MGRAQAGRESSLLVPALLLLGVKHDVDTAIEGWPWFPGAAAWVSPTALSLLALAKAAKSFPGMDLAARCYEGQRYLLSRMCSDGGWNHGSSRALGHDAASYPETTGLALLALRGVKSVRLERSLVLAERYASAPQSAEAAGWLCLGLLAHGRMPPVTGNEPRARTITDLALSIMSEAALHGRNIFDAT